MGISIDRDDVVSSVPYDREAAQALAGLEDARAAAMQQILGQAVTRNLVIGAGKTFKVGIPEDLGEIDAIDLRTASAMTDDSPRPLPMDVQGDVAIFQATPTSAIATRAITSSAIELYTGEPPTVWNYGTTGIAAD